jgi:hypothetical protein
MLSIQQFTNIINFINNIRINHNLSYLDFNTNLETINYPIIIYYTGKYYNNLSQNLTNIIELIILSSYNLYKINNLKNENLNLLISNILNKNITTIYIKYQNTVINNKNKLELSFYFQ